MLNLFVFDTKPTPYPFELNEVEDVPLNFSSFFFVSKSFDLLNDDNVLLIYVDKGLFVSVLTKVFSNLDGIEPKFVFVKAV